MGRISHSYYHYYYYEFFLSCSVKKVCFVFRQVSLNLNIFLCRMKWNLVNISGKKNRKKKSHKKNLQKSQKRFKKKKKEEEKKKEVKHNKSQILEANFSAQGPRISSSIRKRWMIDCVWGNGEIALTDDL